MASNLNRGIKDLYDNPLGADEDWDNLGDNSNLPVSHIITAKKNKSPFLLKWKTNIKESFKNHKADYRYLLYAIPIIAIFLVAGIVQNRQNWFSKADIHTATVSFQLTNWSLPPENKFGVWLNTDSPVGFANIDLAFDPSLVKMTQEVSVKTSLTKIIKVTSKTEANNTGRVSIILGLDPTRIGNAPTGSFQIADVFFDVNTANKNITSSVSFTKSSMQIVATDTNPFTITTSDLNLKINPSPTPTAAPTAGPTEVPTAAPTAAPTGAPTTAPTAAPTAAPTGAPTAAPTGAPTTAPSGAPTTAPTGSATTQPTAAPTTAPTAAPTAAPAAPTAAPTAAPLASQPTNPPAASSGSSGSSGSSASTSTKPSDINGDGRVDITDLSKLLTNYNKPTSVGDINHDGRVDITDLSLLLSNWNK